MLSTNKPLQHWKSKRGASLIELIIVTIVFAIMVPASLGIFVSSRKIIGQAFIQHQAATTLRETNEILHYLRNLEFSQLANGDFYLIRNPGTGSWLVKADLPDMDVFERFISVSNAFRHEATDNIYFDDDTGPSVEDPDTKKVEVSILWAPDYIPLDLITQTIYISNWHMPITY